VASQQREPHVILNPESRRVGGSGGYNRLVGSYELHGDQLAFSQMAGTMMACLEGTDTEQAFLEALKRVHTWKITGHTSSCLTPLAPWWPAVKPVTCSNLVAMQFALSVVE
jgi:heat shock protein HslJ